MKDKPHKFILQTSQDRDWATGVWNPNLCQVCERSEKHPIHSDKYLNAPDKYKQDHPHKQ